MMTAEKRKKYLQKIMQNVWSRKTKYFRRDLHINGRNANIKIIILKTQQDIKWEVNGFSQLPQDVCFFIRGWRWKYLPTINWSDKDMVVCHHTTKKVLYVINQPVQNVLKLNLPNFYDIWIFNKNTSTMCVKVGDILFTR